MIGRLRELRKQLRMKCSVCSANKNDRAARMFYSITQDREGIVFCSSFVYALVGRAEFLYNPRYNNMTKRFVRSAVSNRFNVLLSWLLATNS